MQDSTPKKTPPALRPGATIWRYERAERFSLIVDADSYFVAARAAMLAATKSILLVGWDFDARIHFGKPDDEGPQKLGDFILWLADRTPALEIRLLRWDTGAIKAMFRGSTLYTILRWKAHPRITLRLDAAHPLAGSHHQKLVAIDDCFAFCGGIDMTSERWDTRDHTDNDPRRVAPNGNPCGPWHDATTGFDGAAAAAIGELARDRWLAATGERLPAVKERHDCWPAMLQPTLRHVDVGIARTRPQREDVTPIHEIEELYVALIASARRLVYAESQYFSSRRIARAIAMRLAEEDGPEIVVINPVQADGWLEPLAMDTARARLFEALSRLDRHKRFRIYHPQTAGGTPIYVHAKIMIVDDRHMRVGSSNFNNRSMRLDTECDVVVSADLPAAAPCETIAAVRNDLLAEHLNVSAAQVASRHAAHGSLIKAIEGLRGEGRTLIPYELPELREAEKWLADNEILDPEGPDAIFESLSQRGLFRHWHFPRLRRRRA